ncbi:Uncharacterised protein [Legionella feeleii]|uniref:Uncharacterized protein n=1 Tax=Legionella feeleii TaxID=453 RepID=A0A2X1QNR7_9GAMM|nr:Uncharacterised protein [Legionella feeleii]
MFNACIDNRVTVADTSGLINGYRSNDFLQRLKINFQSLI